MRQTQSIRCILKKGPYVFTVLSLEKQPPREKNILVSADEMLNYVHQLLARFVHLSFSTLYGGR